MSAAPTWGRPALDALLQRFDALAAAQPCPGLPADVARREGADHGYHVIFGCIVHGDEVGSLPAAVAVLEAIDAGALRYGGRLSVVLGNRPAALLNQRFVEADLNRVFLPDAPPSAEARRAAALIPLLDTADIFLDLHQTIEPTASPFAIFPWSPEGEQWVRALNAAPCWVTRPPGVNFSPGLRCADEHVRLRGASGITVELGQKGFDPAAAALAERLMRETLRIADQLGRGAQTLAGAAEGQPSPIAYEPDSHVAFTDPRMALRPGLQNLAPVRRGEVLSAEGSPLILSPGEGALLFPKYPPRDAEGRALGPLPAELVRVVRRLPDGPAAAYGPR